MRARGVPAQLTRAILVEYQSSKVEILLEGVHMTVVEMKRGVKQGSPLPPMLFAITLDLALEDYYKRWQQEEKGANNLVSDLDVRGFDRPARERGRYRNDFCR